MPKAIHKTPTRDYVLELVRKNPGLSCKQLTECSEHPNGLSEHSINSALSHLSLTDKTIWRIRQQFCDVNGHPTYKFIYFLYGSPEHIRFAETNRLPIPGKRSHKTSSAFADAGYKAGDIPTLATLALITVSAVSDYEQLRQAQKQVPIQQTTTNED